MSIEPDAIRKSYPRWVLIVLSMCLVAAPVIAHYYWSHSLVVFGIVGFYLCVGLYLKSSIIVFTMLGILYSPFLGTSHYSSEEKLWGSLIPWGCIGFSAGLILELMGSDTTPTRR